MNKHYPIGTPGQPWGDSERAQWRDAQQIRRSYRQDVVDRMEALADDFECIQYGALPQNPQRYPLLALRLRRWQIENPTVLITGGVHGYETSGVHGALEFATQCAADYAPRYNLLIAPCVSPWGYEVINRWNPEAVDPNRSFILPSPAEEAAALMRLVKDQSPSYLAHLDLHETTDSDESEFRPALAARDGKIFEPIDIPDGYYTVGDSSNPQVEFHQAIIDEVAKITHIAPADSRDQIIGVSVTQPGMIHLPVKAIGLCAGITDAPYCSTTEVYPDSPRVTPGICIQAQLAAIRGALDFLS